MTCLFSTLIRVQSLYNVGLVSVAQQSDQLYVYIYPLFLDFLPIQEGGPTLDRGVGKEP